MNSKKIPRLAILRLVPLGIMAAFSVGVTVRSPAQDLPEPLRGAKRVVFLGDSITWAGGYIVEIEIALAMRHPGASLEIINLGLPSETLSGLTEPNHAGGAFPRPDLHERLSRVLEMAKPDLVVACYGMNDGIYHPLSRERFEAFKAGFRRLRTSVLASGAKLVFLTSPPFDSLPIKASTLPAGRDVYPSGQPFEGYDDVLGSYAKWLTSQRLSCTRFVDVHTPLRRFIDLRRKAEPSFSLAADGVHLNDEGHRLIARELLKAWKLPGNAAEKASPELRKLVHERHTLLRDAWLSGVGHKRPGMPKGLPLEEAKSKAEALTARIRETVP